MHYFFEDLTGVAAATPLAVLLILMPGFGLAYLLAKAGVIAGDRNRTCWALALGPALLPAVDALLLRWLGFAGVLALHLGLAGVGAASFLHTVRRVPARWWLVVSGCWLAAAWTNVDFDWGGRLYQTAMAVDGVKHAAVVGSLAQFGVPLHDPFFARSQPAGYYYYFYIAPALLHWLGGALVSSRAAFTAATFTTLLALPALLILLADAAALIPGDARRRFTKIVILLCCLSGFDLLPGLWMWVRLGHVIGQLDWWDEEIRWGLSSVLWEPHHMTAVIAVFTGCLLAASGRGAIALRSALAGIAFATAFGCSVWVAIGAILILAFWWLYERVKLGAADMWTLPLSGIAALLVAIPQIGDIQSGRAPGGSPLGFYVRPVGPVRVLPHGIAEWITHLAVVPCGYFIEFGIFAIGAIVFLKRGPLAETRSTQIGRLLLVAAPVALLLVTFVRSTVLYNDFGWRAVWLAQVPAILWTASVLSAPREQPARSPIWIAAFSLGLAATLWDMAGMRFTYPASFESFVNARPDVDYDMRGAYGWANRNLPANAVLQHNPSAGSRAMDFGLYSDHPVAVADAEARLFGASEPAVEQSLALLNPIYDRPLGAQDVRQRAQAAGVDAILLSSVDPVWRIGHGPPAAWPCEYRSLQSCIVLVEKL